jgi:hypothetical protein
MRECLDEGMLQSYFDGELSSQQMEGVTLHLVSCMKCAAVARELEGEFLLLSSALAHEFDATVPTERLRHRIDVAVAGLQLDNQIAARNPSVMPGRGWLQSLNALFAFTPQRTFGYAALAVMLVFGTILGVIQLRQSATVNNAENIAAGPPATVTEPKVTETPKVIETPHTGSNPVAPVTPATGTPTTVDASDRVRRTRPLRQPATVSNEAVAEVKLLPGERSYLKTIAALDSTIKSKSNRPMRPSLRAEYERNLAVVDRALAATRNAAKKNPNDPDAAEFMFNAYQSKVDLLITVADARLYNRP